MSGDADDIQVWEDDPGIDPSTRNPIRRPLPRLDQGPLPVELDQPEPPPDGVGTAAFRYWTAAHAFARAAEFWASLLPAGVSWYCDVGPRLRVELDKGEDLNAFYTRAGLEFYHDTVEGVVCYSGESPDILCHEFGHAVLDALRPELWSVSSIEAAAFHESFGDMSAILVGLQLPSMREELLSETQGRLWRSSRVSRIAEQMGWALGQRSPGSADTRALRDAANSWFYRDPGGLPPQAPATVLSSAAHSFSRVFTGAFLKVLAGMFKATDGSDQALVTCVRDAGQLLVDAVRSAPIVPAYFSSVAAEMVAADTTRFEGRHRDALMFGFVRHGVLAIARATALPSVGSSAHEGGTTPARDFDDGPLARLPLCGAAYGLPQDLLTDAPSATARSGVAPSATDTGALEAHSAAHASACYVEDLFRMARVDTGGSGSDLSITGDAAFKTHELREESGGLLLSRRLFDCGFG